MKKSEKRRLRGKVVSAKGSKTVVVSVVRRFKHPTYSKFVNRSKKYHVHDQNSTAKEGDMVMIVESLPHSKLKRWELV